MPVSHHTKELERIKAILKQLPLLAAAEAESFFRSNFDVQGWQGDNGLVKWAQRKRDTSKRAILVGKGSGQLRKGIKKFAKGGIAGAKVTGVAAKYADIHNFGGKIKVPVTPKLRRWAWAMYYKAGGQRYKAAGKTMGERSAWSPQVSKEVNFWKGIALSRKRFLNITMPKRQFIGNSKQLDNRLKKLFEDKVKQAATV